MCFPIPLSINHSSQHTRYILLKPKTDKRKSAACRTTPHQKHFGLQRQLPIITLNDLFYTSKCYRLRDTTLLETGAPELPCVALTEREKQLVFDWPTVLNIQQRGGVRDEYISLLQDQIRETHTHTHTHTHTGIQTDTHTYVNCPTYSHNTSNLGMLLFIKFGRN